MFFHCGFLICWG